MLVAAVLRPEEREDGELEVVRVAPEQRADSLVLPVREAECAMERRFRHAAQAGQLSRGVRLRTAAFATPATSAGTSAEREHDRELSERERDRAERLVERRHVDRREQKRERADDRELEVAVPREPPRRTGARRDTRRRRRARRARPSRTQRSGPLRGEARARRGTRRARRARRRFRRRAAPATLPRPRSSLVAPRRYACRPAGSRASAIAGRPVGEQVDREHLDDRHRRAEPGDDRHCEEHDLADVGREQEREERADVARRSASPRGRRRRSSRSCRR